jgi:hypothetical protein
MEQSREKIASGTFEEWARERILVLQKCNTTST